MWLWGLLMLVGIALLVLVAVRLFSGGGRGGFQSGGFAHPGQPGPGGPWPGPGGPGQGGAAGPAEILDERLRERGTHR